MANNKILILGATGMLGHTLFRNSVKENKYEIYGTIRNKKDLKYFKTNKENIISNIDALRINSIKKIINEIKPDIVINCIGIIKQLKECENYIKTITINALFPHQLTKICKNNKAKLILISSDCVFDGLKGNYKETDESTANDLYGKTKYLGEIVNEKHVLTLRTSIIGHELKNHVSLLDWFLNQNNEVKGFVNAVYTGFTTIEFSNIILNFVIPNKELYGLYNISSNKINKYKLLLLISKIYNKNIRIIPFREFYCERSLDSTVFRKITNYNPPSWESMISDMHNDNVVNYLNNKI